MVRAGEGGTDAVPLNSAGRPQVKTRVTAFAQWYNRIGSKASETPLLQSAGAPGGEWN